MLLNIEKSGEQDKECSKEWFVNMDPGLTACVKRLASDTTFGLIRYAPFKIQTSTCSDDYDMLIVIIFHLDCMVKGF